MNKSAAQRAHAKRRALERYGLEINRHQMREIVKQIQSGKAKHLLTQSNRTSVKLVSFNNTELIAVYDKLRKNIVTFLPNKEQKEQEK